MSTGFCPNCGDPYPPGQFSCPNCLRHSFDDGNPYASPPPGPAGPVPGMYNLRDVAFKQRLLILAVGLLLATIVIYIALMIPLMIIIPRSVDPNTGRFPNNEPPPAMMALAIVAGLDQFAYVGAVVFAIVAVVMLSAAIRYDMALRILFAVLMFCPCINIIVMLVVNGQATKILTQNGISVGFFGAGSRQFDRGPGL